ncbi:MAG: PAS domain-containing protein, partial [Synergistaceae bacterium]|nr:PAS domain-containing protein [Synergistaceae bacterium]
MSIVKWATLPPIVSIATISLARAMGSALAAVSVDASIWGLVAVTFVILTALYALFIVHGFHVGLLPLQAVAQGILLCPLSLSLGARMFDWAGATMAVCGAAVLAVLYHRTQIRHLYEAAEAEVEAIARVGEMQLHIPVAFAVTDGEGTIVSISDAMLKAAGLVRGEAVGQSIAVILTPGEDVVE